MNAAMIRAEEQLVQRAVGRGLLAPELRVFHLYVVQNANPVDFPRTPQGAIALEASGSCLLYDPAGAEFAADLLVSIDTKDPDVDTFTTLQPGVSYDLRPANFNKLFLRSLARYVNSFAGTTSRFIGKLIVSPSFIGSSAGSSPDTPIYTREAPLTCRVGQALASESGTTNWSAVGGGSGIMSFRFDVPGITAAATLSGYEVTIENIGDQPIYVSNNGALTTPSALTRQLLFPLAIGAARTFRARPLPNTAEDPTRVSLQTFHVYAQTDTAALAFYTELLQ